MMLKIYKANRKQILVNPRFYARSSIAVCLVCVYVKTHFTKLQDSLWATFYTWIYLPIL